jgi:gas vesicle protein
MMKASWGNFVTGLADENADLSTLMDSVIDSFVTVVDNIVPKFIEALPKIVGAIEYMAGSIAGYLPDIVKTLLPSLLSAAMSLLQSIANLLIKSLPGIVNDIFQNLTPHLEKGGDIIRETLVSVFGNEFISKMENTFSLFKQMVGELWTENKDKIEKIGELFGVVFDRIAGIGNWFYESIILGIFVPAIEWISQVVSENMDNIKAYFQAAFDIIGGIIDFFIALFKGDWQGMWDAVLSIIKSAIEMAKNWFTILKNFIAEIMNGIWSKVVEIWENIKISISSKVSNIVETVKGKFDDVKQSITNKINDAKEAVRTAIDTIKGFFNFEFKWPNIPLPHFRIDPEGWKIGDLLKGVLPSLGIEWYAKGGVLEDPTAFGINGNKLMVGGEAGAEAIAPIDVLQKYISEAVAAQNAGLVDVLQKILAAILSNNEEMKDKFMEALEEMRFDINNREFARLVKAVN